MQFWMHGRIKCDGWQKGANSIALEHSRRTALSKGIVLTWGTRSIRMSAGDRSHCVPLTVRAIADILLSLWHFALSWTYCCPFNTSPLSCIYSCPFNTSRYRGYYCPFDSTSFRGILSLRQFVCGGIFLIWKVLPDVEYCPLDGMPYNNNNNNNNPTRLAQRTSQFKTRMNITIKTRNMHTPDNPTPTSKRRQTCTHPRTVNATKTCNTAMHGPWTHLMTANQMQRASW